MTRQSSSLRSLTACVQRKNQAKYINYTFDYKFDLVNQSEDIVDFEKEIPSKYKPKRYKGDDYESGRVFT